VSGDVPGGVAGAVGSARRALAGVLSAGSGPRGPVDLGPFLGSVELEGWQARRWVLARQAEGLRAARDAIDGGLASVVAESREAGASWAEVGEMLGTTGQAVQQRFGARPGVRGGRVGVRRAGYVSTRERAAQREAERARVVEAREAYDRYLTGRWEAAVEATGGRLLTEVGVRRRVNARKLLDRWTHQGTPVHASPELASWVAEHGPAVGWAGWLDRYPG
jgi:hypothetical protein